MSPPVLRGVVLAGGRSRRMGRDKAALTYRGRTLLDHAVDMLSPFCSDIRVAIAPDQRSDTLRHRHPVVVDPVSDGGPMAGLLAAFALDPAAAWWALAVDLPFLKPETLGRLAAARGTKPACAVTHDGRPEPLCAIYEPGAAKPLGDWFDQGNRSLRGWLEAVDAPLVPAESGELRNLNTPELEKFLQE
ncbi:MAG: molybdenum cofactor guanylyltransferase [Xanthomonadales bacterium]|nr:molybdenum cofactor guanylyltransferase [Xanthomonadales bacterium]